MVRKIDMADIEAMSVDERLVLVSAIWDTIVAENAGSHLTEEKREELRKRVAEHEAQPDDVVPWEQINAEIDSRWPA